MRVLVFAALVGFSVASPVFQVPVTFSNQGWRVYALPHNSVSFSTDRIAEPDVRFNGPLFKVVTIGAAAVPSVDTVTHVARIPVLETRKPYVATVTVPASAVVLAVSTVSVLQHREQSNQVFVNRDAVAEPLPLVEAPIPVFKSATPVLKSVTPVFKSATPVLKSATVVVTRIPKVHTSVVRSPIDSRDSIVPTLKVSPVIVSSSVLKPFVKSVDPNIFRDADANVIIPKPVVEYVNPFPSAVQSIEVVHPSAGILSVPKVRVAASVAVPVTAIKSTLSASEDAILFTPVLKEAVPLAAIVDNHDASLSTPVFEAPVEAPVLFTAPAAPSPVIVIAPAEPLQAPDPPMPSIETPFVGGQFHSQDESGQYTFGHWGGPNTRVEVRDSFGRTAGSFAYVDPEGEVQVRKYASNPNSGFRVAASDLPVDVNTEA